MSMVCNLSLYFSRVLTIGANLGTALECVLDIIPKLEDVSSSILSVFKIVGFFVN